MRLRVVTPVFVLVMALVACGSAKSILPTASPPASTITATVSRPISTTISTPAAASVAAPVTTSLSSTGSFSAFCAAIRVRFQAPARVMQDPSSCQGNTLFLSTNIADDSGVEFFTVFRYTGDARGQTATGWADILESFRVIDTQSGDTAWSAATVPIPQASQGTMGFSGPFARTDKGGMRYAGSLWAGAVGADTIVVLIQGSVDRHATLESDMKQALMTLDLNAQ